MHHPRPRSSQCLCMRGVGSGGGHNALDANKSQHAHTTHRQFKLTHRAYTNDSLDARTAHRQFEVTHRAYTKPLVEVTTTMSVPEGSGVVAGELCIPINSFNAANTRHQGSRDEADKRCGHRPIQMGANTCAVLRSLTAIPKGPAGRGNSMSSSTEAVGRSTTSKALVELHTKAASQSCTNSQTQHPIASACSLLAHTGPSFPRWVSECVGRGGGGVAGIGADCAQEKFKQPTAPAAERQTPRGHRLTCPHTRTVHPTM